MEDAEITKLFAPLFAGLDGEDTFPKKRPLLAHYTSVGVLDAFLDKNELWFSNPLFMNDIEEVRFGATAATEMGWRLFLIRGNSPRVGSRHLSSQMFTMPRQKSAWSGYERGLRNLRG